MNKPAEKEQRKKLKKRQTVILIAMLCALLILMISFAWYYFTVDREGDSEEATVLGPYYLYLVDEEGESLQLTVGSLHPGETKYVIIGVGNQGTASILGEEGSDYTYDIELAYTQNLPVIYRLHRLKDEVGGEFHVEDPYKKEARALTPEALVKLDAESLSLTEANNAEMYGAESVVNEVKYDVYSGFSTSEGMGYYLMEIEWEEGIEFRNFIKETDLVYIIVKAVQPRPQEE